MIIYGFRQKKKKRKYKPKPEVKHGTEEFHDYMAVTHSAGRLQEAYYRAYNLKEKQTPSEQITEETLKALGVKFESQYVIFYRHGEYRIVDFYLPDHRIVLEIDGKCHLTSSQYDQYKDRQTRFKTLRIKNEETAKDGFKEQLSRMLGIQINTSPPKTTQATHQPNYGGPLINTSRGYTLKEMKEAGLL